MHSPFIGNAQKITYPDLKFAYKLRGLYMETFAVYRLVMITGNGKAGRKTKSFINI